VAQNVAQLRDRVTSTLLAEGTPHEMVLVADELGAAEVLYDGVGLAFDPDVVRAVEDERLKGLADVVKDGSLDATAKEAAQAAVAAAAAVEAKAAAAAATAGASMAAARARLPRP
jgi:hypothetical protein